MSIVQVTSDDETRVDARQRDARAECTAPAHVFPHGRRGRQRRLTCIKRDGYRWRSVFVRMARFPDRPMKTRALWTSLLLTIVLGLSGCGYNTIQTEDEQVKASWSEVLNQYQRRADLVPNLV